MSGPLIINHGSPNWWLSPDIWVTPHGQPGTVVANPIAGKDYDVWVRISNPYPLPVDDWNLFVCWAIPTAGPIPLPPNGQDLNGAPFGAPLGNVPANSDQPFKASTIWQPSYVNGGHECLVAVTYFQDVGFPFNSLNGDAGPTGDWSIAQHNLGVLPVTQIRPRFNYAFQIYNEADEERQFVVTARQAPLKEIAAFLPGVPGGQKLVEKPGKVEHLGIVASAHPDPAEMEYAQSVLNSVKIPPRSCHAFTLGGTLPGGNALIHVTQSRDDRVVGGLSVLVMSEEK